MTFVFYLYAKHNSFDIFGTFSAPVKDKISRKALLNQSYPLTQVFRATARRMTHNLITVQQTLFIPP